MPFKSSRQRKAYFGLGGHDGIAVMSASKADVDAIMNKLLANGDIVLDSVPEHDDDDMTDPDDMDSEILDYDEDGAEL